MYILISYMHFHYGAALIKLTFINFKFSKTKPSALAIIISTVFLQHYPSTTNQEYWKLKSYTYSNTQKTPSTCLSSLFTDISTIHNLKTSAQNQKQLYLPKFSTNRCQRSVKFHGVKIWNSIPIKLKILSFHQFKIKFKRQLITNYLWIT